MQLDCTLALCRSEKCEHGMKNPEAATGALSQHTPISATCMNNQAGFLPNCKTKQNLQKSSSVQKAWANSIKGDSEAANFSECGNFFMCVIFNKKINIKNHFR